MRVPVMAFKRVRYGTRGVAADLGRLALAITLLSLLAAGWLLAALAPNTHSRFEAMAPSRSPQAATVGISDITGSIAPAWSVSKPVR